MPGRSKGKQPVVIEPDTVEGELLPVCQAPGCRVVCRPDEVLCDGHHVVQRRLAAYRRLAQGAPLAAEVLVDLVENSANDETRRRAAEAVLDRTGLRPGLDVSVTETKAEGTSPAEILRARLDRLRERSLAVAESASEPETP
jgi:hypothetical protein